MNSFPARILLAATLMVAVFLITAAALADKDGGILTAEERAAAINDLEATRDKVLRIAAALSDEGWNFKPGPDRWSVAEVVEHLRLTEGFLLQNIDAALAADVDSEWAQKTEGRVDTLRQLLTDRSKRFKAPEPLRPGDGVATPTNRRELVKGYLAGRDKTLAAARQADGPVKARLVDNENFGPMSAYHWFHFIAFHNDRHNQQIDEILADPNFPG